MDESKQKINADYAHANNQDVASTSDNDEVLPLWPVLAPAWEFAAFSFRYPGKELAEAVASGEWAEAAHEIADVLGLKLRKGFGTRIADDDANDEVSADKNAPEGKDTLLHTLRAEATRLFIGSPDPVCSPYEGIWRAADDEVQALLFVNPHSMDVERFMKACGLGRPKGTNEPLDHVSTECELMEHLVLRASGIAPHENMPAAADLPEGSPEAAYSFFLDNHVRTWMPRFAERTASQTRLPFYRDAAAYLEALVAR